MGERGIECLVHVREGSRLAGGRARRDEGEECECVSDRGCKRCRESVGGNEVRGRSA